MLARRAASAILGSPRLAVVVVVLISGIVGMVVRYTAESSSPSGVFGGPTAPPAVTDLLESLFSERVCHDPLASEQAVRQGLDAADLTDWSVRIASVVKPSDCVASTYDVDRREVVLNLAMRPEIKRAITRVAEELLRDCLGRGQAESLLRDTLIAVGATSFELRTDGSEAGPVEREAEVHAHFEAGCWIYSGSGWQADGTPIYMIGGR